jgi:hypothetical protein
LYGYEFQPCEFGNGGGSGGGPEACCAVSAVVADKVDSVVEAETLAGVKVGA